MATIDLWLYENNQYTTKLKLQIDYTLGIGTITINSITGYSYNGYNYEYTKDNAFHQISFPGGSGKITSLYTGYNGSGNGCGASSSGYKWKITPTTFYSTSSEEGYISLTTPAMTGTGSLSNAVFWNKKEDNISIPNTTAPTLSTLSFSNVSYNSITVSFSVENTGGKDITAKGVGIRNYGSIDNPHQWIYSTPATFTGLTPNTNYEFLGWATNDDAGINRPDGALETYTKYYSKATNTILPPQLSAFSIQTPSNRQITLSYTLPSLVNKIFGWIEINSQKITNFDSFDPASDIKEIKRTEKPGASNDPCFVFTPSKNNITITLLKSNTLKEGDKIEVWLLTGIDYEGKEYYKDRDWISAEKTYQSAPWIFISPYGKIANEYKDYEEVEMIILNSDYKTKIQSSKSEKEVTTE